MNTTTPIAVVGGTGKSGTYLVNELLKRGYSLRLLLRNPAHFTKTYGQVEIVHGNVTDYGAVSSLLEGCSAVVSTLGLGVPPSGPTIFTSSTSHVLRAMQAHGLRRYILTTGLNVDTPLDRKGPRAAGATDWMKQTYPLSTANKQQEYELLAASSADWTLLRLPVIALSEERPPLALSLRDCPGDQISAASLACFLADQLSAESYFRQAPFLANG